MKLSAVGEFGLIERIKGLLSRPTHAILGIGDDCAVWRPTAGLDLLVTTDLLVEQVDFTLETTTPFRLGRKAMAVSLSDIAAMGGLPRAALITLALPSELEAEFVDELYRGLQKEGSKHGVEFIGGDISASSTLMIGVTVVGEAEPGQAVTRAGAKPGERIWITGRLGGSAAGLAALQTGFRLRDDQVEGPPETSGELIAGIREALERHLCPSPRIREGRALAAAGVASAMIDLSDGLATDLGHLCRESGVSARIRKDRIPVDPVASIIGGLVGQDPMGMALAGGEDFELLFTSPACADDVVRLFPDDQAVTEVGEVTAPGEGCVLVQRNGAAVPLSGGYEHFRRS
ncbi:MAG: thiamine-phosphate kinase [Candidatus Methylomirabilaceae bacterium]